MKKIALAGLFAIMLSCGPAKVAQPAPVEAGVKNEEPLKEKLETGLLWKISGNDLERPSYLYGTMHITCDATLNNNVLDALKYTDQLYLELDMDDNTLAGKMMAGIMMKDGTTFKTLTSPEELVIVDEFLKKNLGMEARMVEKYKPGVVEMMVMPKMIDCEMQSVEEQLMKIVHQDGEDVLGLETVEEQMALFDAIPYKEQMDGLVKLAREGVDKGKQRFADMDKIYQGGDIEEILEFMQKEENNIGKSSDILLGGRNKKWIPRMEEIAKAKPTFFGVGAAHLPGPDGVIALLRDKGYTVEAVAVEKSEK